jgi:hypothetical protein
MGFSIDERERTSLSCVLDILVRLFLFGVAFEREIVQRALDSMAIFSIGWRNWIVDHPSDCTDPLGSEVQSYPISFVDLGLVLTDCIAKNKGWCFLTE